VHPTPATSDVEILAHDLLAALGKPTRRLGEERISGGTLAWNAVTAWILGECITSLIVLRAHLMGERRWNRLLQLWRDTGVRLVLVYHRNSVTASARRLLDDVPHRVTADASEVLSVPDGPVPGLVAVQDTIGQADLPPLPGSAVAHFRADAYRQLDAVDFARVDAEYTAGLESACAWLCRHRDYQRVTPPDHVMRSVFPPYLTPQEITAGIAVLENYFTDKQLVDLGQGLMCVGRRDRHAMGYPYAWADESGLQCFLSGLVAEVTSSRRAIARIRGAQAGFLLHGLLLDVPRDLDSQAGPGITTGPLTMEVADRVRRGIAHPQMAAAVLATVFTSLDAERLVEVAVEGVAVDGSRFVHDLTKTAYGVPEPARGVLRAARIFCCMRDSPSRALFSGIGLKQERLARAAAACQVPLPLQLGAARAGAPWHRMAACWWVSDPIHGPGPERSADMYPLVGPR
jgi:hypothetical protein